MLDEEVDKRNFERIYLKYHDDILRRTYNILRNDEDVKDAPTFAQIAKSLSQFIEGCDFGGFNSNRFDLPMLVEEFLRARVDVDFRRRKFIDVQNIFHKMEQRTLVAAYRFYCDKELDNAHSAEADTRATYEVLKAQLDR
mgnify:CR=1 FL=1